MSAQKRKQLDELQAEALKYLVEVFTEDEKNSADDVYNFLVKAGGDKFAGKIVRRSPAAFYEQAHYERGIEAYELMLKLDPSGPRRAGYASRDRRRATPPSRDWPKLQDHLRAHSQDVHPPRAGGVRRAAAWARTQS